MTSPQPPDQPAPCCTHSPPQAAGGNDGPPPPRHKIDVTVGDHIVIVETSDGTLADAAAIAWDLHERSRPEARPVVGFTASARPPGPPAAANGYAGETSGARVTRYLLGYPPATP